MRFWEIGMLGLLLGAAGWSILGRRWHDPARRAGLLALGGLSFLALILSFALDGARWQMIPAYVGVLLLLPLLVARGYVLRGILAAAIFFLAMSACIASALLPIFQLPAPTGPYATGTRMLYLVDPTRSNAPAPGTNAGRNIAVQLWYPAAPSAKKFAAYRMLAESTVRTSYMSAVPTHSRLNAPVAHGSTPWHVVLFNPAWDERRGQSTALLEDLASHGYVVAAIDHPGRTGPVWLPDGRVVPVLPDPDIDDEAHSSVAGIEGAVAREVDKEAGDDSFVLDQLALQNRDSGSSLYQRLNTAQAGVLGHSLGGSVAADACSLDVRLLSALSLSGPFFGKVRATGLRKPYLNISEDVTLATPQQLAHMDYADRIDGETDILDEDAFRSLLQKNGGYRVTIAGINHSSFTDKAFYSPLRSLSGEGKTPRERVLFILRSYAVQFFDKTLEGKAAPLLDATHPFPEVTQQYFPGVGGRP